MGAHADQKKTHLECCLADPELNLVNSIKIKTGAAFLEKLAACSPILVEVSCTVTSCGGVVAGTPTN